jgi:acetolactate synthase-1/2/3 large subunit
MQLTVSQYVVRFLKAEGIRTVFELSGGMIMHLLDAVQQEGGIELLNVYHEQAAAFAADATGRLSGLPGVAFGTSGPGATNLLTGIGSSFFDSSPTVFITGQVNRHEQKGTREIRQLGFQETDIVAMARPVTKLAVRVTEPAQIVELLPRAFALATAGRPGAVLLDIPMDVFRAVIEVAGPPAASAVRPEPAIPAAGVGEAIEELKRALAVAERPLILAGGGIRAALAQSELAHFAEGLSIPAVHSLLACDVLPHGHPLRVGMIGTYGNRWANLALAESDLLLVLGSRLDIRQTGADTRSFGAGRRIFHVDVEAAEINNRVTNCVAIHCDLRGFFAHAMPAAPVPADTGRQRWLARIGELRDQWPDTAELAGASGINPNVLMHEVSRGRRMGAVCVDVGLHQMWAAQSLELAAPARFLTSGGMGAMGFALPAALGAACHWRRQLPVLVIAGDAGFQLNIQELQTIAHHRLPVKIVVMNNRCHGMTRQFQDTYFAARYTGTVWGYSTPDFAAVAAAYGLPSRLLSEPADLGAACDWLWQEPLAPALLEVAIDLHTNAYPKMAFGKPISEMEPFAKPLGMEAT